MKETQDILDGKKQAKTYTSAEEMLEDIENTKDDQDNWFSIDQSLESLATPNFFMLISLFAVKDA